MASRAHTATRAISLFVAPPPVLILNGLFDISSPSVGPLRPVDVDSSMKQVPELRKQGTLGGTLVQWGAQWKGASEWATINSKP